MSRAAIVVSFDRLHLGFLGPYGNEWIETPTLNHLAADAVVFEECLGDPCSPDDPPHAWWREGAWLAGLRSRGVRTVAVCDNHLPPAVHAAFDHVQPVGGEDGPEYSEADGAFARLMTEAQRTATSLAGSGSPSLLWVRSRGVARPWLPPRELADLYLDEFGLATDSAESDDEEPAEVLHLAGRESDLPYIKAMYAATVSYLDRWLAILLAAAGGFREAPLVIVTAAAGEELGEHGEPGATLESLYSPVLHVPLFVRWPGFDDGSRRHALVAAADIPPTICEWLGVPFAGRADDQPPGWSCLPASLGPLIRSEVETIRDELPIITAGHVGLRTAEYYYLRSRNPPADGAIDTAELFEKPFDRWDLANRSSMFPGIVEELECRLPEADRG